MHWRFPILMPATILGGLDIPAWRVSGRLVLLLAWCVCGQISPVSAADTPNRPPHFQAQAVLFDEDVLADNVWQVRKHAQSLPLDARYDYLHSWVLPTHTPETVRLFAELTTSEPAPPVQDDHPYDLLRLRLAAERQQRRVEIGGNLVSPVYDLIDTARLLKRLDQLRADVDARRVKEEIPQRGKLCLLTLIDMARGEEKAAAANADQLFTRLTTGVAPKLIDRMPETLFVWAATERGMLLNEVERFLAPMWENQIRPALNSGPGEWDRMIPILQGRVRHARDYADHSSQPYNSAPALSTWHSATRKHSWVNAAGVPAAHWQLDQGTVACLSRHDDEFLFYGSPLSGDFAVECLCSGFGYRDSHPFYAGAFLSPVYTMDTVSFGELWKWRSDIPLSPKLSSLDDYTRYRIEVQAGVCSRYINGRLIHEEPLPANHDPWFAIRVPNFGNGHVRDVRITGTPTIPEQLRISEFRTADYADPLPEGVPFRPINRLHGWVPWHDELWKVELQSWQLEDDESGRAVIVGRRSPEHQGAGAERLLRYHWPLVWDSEVTYDFFYSEGQSVAHPALGRLAFLLNPTGLQTHWITNGFWDRTELNPLNAQSITGRSAKLPLKSNAWNAMSLRLTGDTVHLQLNGVLICSDEIEPTNDRTFGVFYDCGEAEARVRNVVLRGDWPKTVPPVEQQELHGTQADMLNVSRDALPDKFEFDFTQTTKQELQELFVVTGNVDMAPNVFELKPDGLHMSVTAPIGEYAAQTVGPILNIEGDFDITSRFENLQLKYPEQGFCGIYHCLLFTQPKPRQYNMIRSVGQYSNHPLRFVVQAEIYNQDPERPGATYPAIFTDQSPAGRMRLARRGKTLTYLYTTFDSDSYQILHSEEITDEALHINGINLRLSAYSQGGTESEASVVWKDLQIHASKIRRPTRVTAPAPMKRRDLEKPPDPAGK